MLRTHARLNEAPQLVGTRNGSMVTPPLWCGEVLGMVAPPCGRMKCGQKRFDME